VALVQPGVVQIVELLTGRETARVSVKEVFESHTSILALGPKGKHLARVVAGSGYGSSRDGLLLEATLMDTASGQQLHQLPLVSRVYLRHLAFSADGQQLGWADYEGRRAGIHDVASGKRLRVYRDPSFLSLSFGPAKRIATCASDSVHVWDQSSDEPIWVAKQGKSGSHRKVVYAPDHSTIVTNADTAITFLDAATGKVKQEITGLPQYVSAIGRSWT
jgi:hypothetical protein